MTPVDFWFDPVSPYAYLAFERLPEAFVGVSYMVSYRPIVFGALLKAYAHKGPAEIEPKRAWTFRQVHWLAHRAGIPLDTPLRHPFNPLVAVAPRLGERAGGRDAEPLCMRDDPAPRLARRRRC
jgi:2-hydroxychromene-2-carboxylate isomerase